MIKMSYDTFKLIIEAIQKQWEMEKKFSKWIEDMIDGNFVSVFWDNYCKLVEDMIKNDYELWEHVRDALSHFCRETDFGNDKDLNSFWYKTWEQFFFGNDYDMILDSIYLAKEEFIEKYKDQVFQKQV